MVRLNRTNSDIERKLEILPNDLTDTPKKSRKRRSDAEPIEKIEHINQILEVSALFWDRDSHGLFDYESKILEDSWIKLMGCCMLVRDDADLKTVMPKLGCPEDYQKLLSIVYKNGSYWIYHT